MQPAHARGLPQIVRTGWYREVAVKGWDSRLVRSLLTSREQLVPTRVDFANEIHSVLTPFGLVAGEGSRQSFVVRVRNLARTVRCGRWPRRYSQPGRPSATKSAP
jgi:transposase